MGQDLLPLSLLDLGISVLSHPLGIGTGVAHFGGRRVQVVRLRREVAQKPRLGTRDSVVSRSFRASEDVPFFLAAVLPT